MNKNLYIIKCGSTFKEIIDKFGDFEDWIIRAIDPDSEIIVINVEAGEPFPAFEKCLGAVITGSHAMVTENLPWSLDTEEWIRNASEKNIPIFGICYGHQLIAEALGGVSDFHKDGIEIGTKEITKTVYAEKDILFKCLPDKFKAHTVHSQSAVVLPEDCVVLASNDHDKHHAFRFNNNIWGVQFHPEYSIEIMQGYLGCMTETLEKKGLDVEKLIQETAETPYPAQILKNFYNYVKQ